MSEHTKEPVPYMSGEVPMVGDVLHWKDGKPQWLSGVDIFTVKRISGPWLCIAEDFYNEDSCGWMPKRFALVRRAATPATPAPSSDAVRGADHRIPWVIAELRRSAQEGFHFNATELRTLADVLAAALAENPT